MCVYLLHTVQDNLTIQTNLAVIPHDPRICKASVMATVPRRRSALVVVHARYWQSMPAGRQRRQCLRYCAKKTQKDAMKCVLTSGSPTDPSLLDGAPCDGRSSIACFVGFSCTFGGPTPRSW